MREALGEARPAIDLEQKVGNLDARQQIIRCISETHCLRRSHRTKRRDFAVTFCQVDIGEFATLSKRCDSRQFCVNAERRLSR